MVDTATEFKKSGFSEEDSAVLAQISAMYQNVADDAISASDASSFIIAQMKAFNIDASDAISIVDQLNAVSNNYAVSSSELAQGLGIVSSALAIGGNNYQEVLGLMTAGTEITRNATKTARGLVSVQSRLNQITDESSSVGQALSDWYEQHGIDVYDKQTGQIKSLYQILSELAPKWKDLTKNEQAYYLNQQAGANQSQNLAAILQNFETAVEATGTALEDSLGSALQENAKYMESLEAQTTMLKATFQDFANNVISKDLVSGALTLLNGALDSANNTVGQSLTQFALLTTGLTGLAGVAKEFLPALASGFKSVFTGATVATTGVKGFAAILGSFAPYAAVISGVVVGLYTLVNFLKDRKTDVNEFTEAIEQNEAKLKENEERLKEINALGWDDKTPEIMSEKAALEKENRELERQIELYKAKRQESAQSVLDNAYYTETTYTTQRIGGKETIVPKTELVEGAQLYVNLTNKLLGYQNILKQTGALNKQQEAEYQALVSQCNNYAVAMENVEGGVQSCTAEQQLLYNTLRNTELTYSNAQESISAYVSGLIEQASQTAKTKSELYNLAAAMVSANNTQLNFTQQIVALQQLAAQAGVAANAVASTFGAAKIQYLTTEKGYTQEQAQTQVLNSYWNQLSSKIQNAQAEIVQSAVTGGGSGSSGSSAASKQIDKVEDEAKDAVTSVANVASSAVDDVSDDVSDAINEQKEMMQKVIDYYVEYASRKIDELQAKLDEINAQYDKLADEAQSRYDSALDALNAEEEALNNQIERRKLLANLEKAKNTYNMVYRNGQFVYEVDQELVDKARQDLNDFYSKQAIQERKKALMEMLEAELKYIAEERKNKTEQLEGEKDRWEEYKKGWEDLTGDYEYEQNKLLAEQLFGANQENITWEQRLANLSSFVQQYNSLMSGLSTGGFGSGGSTGGSLFGGSTSGGATFDADDPSTWTTAYGSEHYKEAGYKTYEDWFWNAYMKGSGRPWTAVDTNYMGGEGGGGTGGTSWEDTDFAALIEKEFKEGRYTGAIDSGVYYWGRMREEKIASLGLEGQVESTRDLIDRLKKEYGYYEDLEYSGSTGSGASSDKTYNQLTQQEKNDLQSQIMALEDQIAANSQAWFEATEEEQKRLHETNEKLRKQLEKLYAQAGIEGYAVGTTSAHGGLSLVGEKGPELRVLNNGDGVIPSDITRNLWDWGKMNPKSASVGGSNIFNISNLSLPSVKTPDQFISGLKKMAMQRAYGRT